MIDPSFHNPDLERDTETVLARVPEGYRHKRIAPVRAA